MLQALEFLRDVPMVRLDATPRGKEVYDKLGFSDEFGLLRLVHRGVPQVEAPHEASPLVLLEQFAPRDEAAFGANRVDLMSRLQNQAPDLAWRIGDGDRLSAICLGRSGTQFTQLGPVIAEDTASARAVVSTALSSLSGEAVVLDVPEQREEFIGWLKSLGFTVQRPYTRMVLGPPRMTAPAERLFAICGPEFG
jgi:hypothetical protein